MLKNVEMCCPTDTSSCITIHHIPVILLSYIWYILHTNIIFVGDKQCHMETYMRMLTRRLATCMFKLYTSHLEQNPCLLHPPVYTLFWEICAGTARRIYIPKTDKYIYIYIYIYTYLYAKLSLIDLIFHDTICIIDDCIMPDLVFMVSTSHYTKSHINWLWVE